VRFCLFILALLAARADAAVFQFLYIEASEGSSSGGHVALQLGEDVYHYQYDDGLIRLFKRNAGAFKIDYRFKQNRTIHAAEVGINEAAFNQLNNHFKLAFFKQKQAVNRLLSAQNDQALLTALLALRQGKKVNPDSQELPLKLPGAGLFYAGQPAQASVSDRFCRTEKASVALIASLKRQLQDRFGASFLSRKSQDLRHEIGNLLPAEGMPSDQNRYAFSEQYADLLTGLLALQVIEKSAPLLENACFTVHSERKLTGAAVEHAKAYRRELLMSAQSLLNSTRPDWGYALLVTLARLITLEQSINTGVWTFVDDSGDEADVIDKLQAALYAEYLNKQRAEDSRRLIRAIDRFSSDSTGYGRHYMNLEIAANRYQHWLKGDRDGAIKYRVEQTLPGKSVSALKYLRTDVPVERLQAALRQKELEINNLLTGNRRQDNYHLLMNNCVTALFVHINAAMNGQSRQLLGGEIESESTIVPFQAFAAVQVRYNVINTRDLLSYRQQALAGMCRHEADSWVYLRESNLLTSSLYKHHPDDGWFVFFTDDAFVMRPLFGAINIVAATGQSVWGLFSWPFESEAKTLQTGARGLMASLPELAFFNIRKGSYPYPIQPELND